VEVLGIDRGKNLRWTELRAEAHHFFVQRAQTLVAGIDAPRRLQELQGDIELTVVQCRLHARDQDFRETLQALPGLAVVWIDDEHLSIQRERAAGQRAGIMSLE